MKTEIHNLENRIMIKLKKKPNTSTNIKKVE